MLLCIYLVPSFLLPKHCDRPCNQREIKENLINLLLMSAGIRHFIPNKEGTTRYSCVLG